MPRSASTRSLLAASLLGVATGMRSFLPLALLSTRRARRGARWVLLPLAVVELVADTQPWIGTRLAPAPLTVRVVAAGIGASWLVLSGRRAPLVLAAVTGALGGALLGHRVRTRLPSATRSPDLPWALAEDVSSAALAGAAIHLAVG